MSEAFISIRGLKKNFGKNEVLQGVDLDVKEGEKVIIMGSSGSGNPRCSVV